MPRDVGMGLTIDERGAGYLRVCLDGVEIGSAHHDLCDNLHLSGRLIEALSGAEFGEAEARLAIHSALPEADGGGENMEAWTAKVRTAEESIEMVDRMARKLGAKGAER